MGTGLTNSDSGRREVAFSSARPSQRLRSAASGRARRRRSKSTITSRPSRTLPRWEALPKGSPSTTRPAHRPATSTWRFPPRLRTVFKFDADGNQIGSIDSGNLSACTGAKDFDNLYGVAVDRSTGNVYVGDPSAGTVTAFDPNGNCLFQIGEGLQTPYGIAIDPTLGADGTLYVADAGDHTIQSFNAATGAPISSFATDRETPSSASRSTTPGTSLPTTSRKKWSSTARAANASTVARRSTAARPGSVAVNPTDNHLFVSTFAQMSEYLPGGTYAGVHLRPGQGGLLQLRDGGQRHHRAGLLDELLRRLG